MRDFIKRIIERYKSTTPKVWVRFGNAILSVSVFAMGYGLVVEDKTLAFVMLGIGAIGKFLTNFFEEKNKN